MKIDVKKNGWTILKYIPIFLFITIMPLTVRLKQVVIKDLNVEGLPSVIVNGDLFNFYKARMVFFGALLAIALLIAGWVIGKVRFSFTRADMAGLAFVGFVVLSSFLADQDAVVWWGYSERWHGTATWISYYVYYYYFKTVINSQKEILHVTRFILLSAVVMVTIGLMQALSMDPFRMDILKKLILPAEYVKNNGLDSMKFTFELNRVYMSLYNPNNVGVYVAGMIPFAVYGIVKDIKIIKGIWSLTVLGAIISLMGSYSRAGLGALAIAFLLYFIINMKSVYKFRKQIVIGLIITMVLVVAGDNLADNVLSRRLFDMGSSRASYTKLQSLSIEESDLLIDYNDQKLVIRFSNENELPKPYTVEGDALAVTQLEDKSLIFQDSTLEGLSYQITRSKDVGFVVTLNMNKRYTMNFANIDNQVKYINSYGKVTDVVDANFVGFEDNLRWGSNRGYIWSRSIPLIFEKPLLGHGPDQFVLSFPQTDYVSKLNAFANPELIVDKPHNQYLGFLVEFGFVGLLLYLIWVGGVLWKARKNIIIVSAVSILVAFLFYDISITTGWLLITSLGILSGDVVKMTSLEEGM